MNDKPDNAVPPGLADLPLDARRARDVETHRELHDRLTRRHLANAEYAEAYDAVQIDRALRIRKREG